MEVHLQCVEIILKFLTSVPFLHYSTGKHQFLNKKNVSRCDWQMTLLNLYRGFCKTSQPFWYDCGGYLQKKSLRIEKLNPFGAAYSVSTASKISDRNEQLEVFNTSVSCD